MLNYDSINNKLAVPFQWLLSRETSDSLITTAKLLTIRQSHQSEMIEEISFSSNYETNFRSLIDGVTRVLKDANYSLLPKRLGRYVNVITETV